MNKLKNSFHPNNPAILFFLGIVLLNCCSFKKGEIESQYYLDITKNHYILNLDHYTSNYEIRSQYLTSWNKKESFAILNRKGNSIKIYDLNSGNLTDSIQFTPDGPEGVGRIYEFYIHNEDSIFLNAKYSYKIHIVNKNGKRINDFLLIPEDVAFDAGGIPENHQTALAESFIFNQGNIVDGYLYLSSRPDRDLMKPDFYDSKELGIKINLKNGKNEYLMGYPESHKGNIWGVRFSTMFSTYNEDERTFIYSFPIDEYIYTTSDHKSFEKHLFNSLDFPKVRPMSKTSKDPSAYLKYTDLNSSYANIIHDPYKKLYYRLGTHKVDEESYTTPTSSFSNPKDIAIIIHDSSFQRIHEETITQPKDGQIMPLMSFVNDSGLNIAFVDYNNEDKLTFVNFNLVENEINEDF